MRTSVIVPIDTINRYIFVIDREFYCVKVAHVAPYFLPVEGGLERHVYYISKELIKRGHKVDVFTSDIDRHGNRLPRHEVIDDINVYLFRTWFKLGDFGAFWPGFLKKLKKYDIVHVHNYRHPHSVLAAIYCKLKKIPCVITTHSPFHPSNRKFLSKILINFYDIFLAKLVDPLYNAIITVNVDEYKVFSRRFPRKTYLIPSAGIEERFLKKEAAQPKAPRKKLKILLIGRVHPSKGILEAVKIIDLAKEVVPNIELNIVGPVEDEIYYDKVKNYIQQNKLESYVKFFGPIYDPTKKFELINKSDLLLVSSPYEAAGLVIIEALARGKPVIARESPGPRTIRELCDCVFCIQLYNTVNEAVSLIKNFFINRKTIAKPEKCLYCAKKFTWSVLSERIDEIYSVLFNKRRAPKRV